MDQTVVNKLLAGNELGKTVFKVFSQRQRHRPYSDLKRFRRHLEQLGTAVNMQQYSELFEGLERAGIGTMSKDRNGHPKSFKWNYPITKLNELVVPASSVSVMIRSKETESNPIEKLKALFVLKGDPSLKKLAEELLNEVEEIILDRDRLQDHVSSMKKMLDGMSKF